MEELRSLGVGQVFPSEQIDLGHGISAKRVNAFRPSFAVFHNPAMSSFGQLLLLEVAHACGVLRGDWREEKWMSELRLDCKVSIPRVSKIAGESFKTEIK